MWRRIERTLQPTSSANVCSLGQQFGTRLAMTFSNSRIGRQRHGEMVAGR